MTETEASGNWIERHVNWSIALAWLAVATISFALLFVSAKESGETLFILYTSLAVLGLAIGACGLQLKGRSISWLFFLFIPMGLIVIFFLGNKRAVVPPEQVS